MNKTGPPDEDARSALQRAALETSAAVLRKQRRAEMDLRDLKEALERKTMEQAKAVALLRATLDASPDGVIATALDGPVLIYNQNFQDMWRLDSGLFIGADPRPLWDRCAAQLVAPAPVLWPLPPELWQTTPIALRDGRTLERRVSANTVAGVASGIVQHWKDVTQQCLVQRTQDLHNRELQDLSRRILGQLESERKHVAFELHERIGQTMAAIKIHLQTAARDRSEAGAAARLVIDNLDDALGNLRDLALNLRPSMLDDFGLDAALRWLVAQVTKQCATTFVYIAPESAVRGALELETLMFRVAQEALSNVIRHAAARTAVVRLTYDAPCMVVEIRDDGCGFDAAILQLTSANDDRVGIAAMRERARAAAGTLLIDTAPGRGCTIRLRCNWRLR